jgi:hypothetical protein
MPFDCAREVGEFAGELNGDKEEEEEEEEEEKVRTGRPTVGDDDANRGSTSSLAL